MVTRLDLAALAVQMRQWRHAIHRQPETAYQEYKTAALVAAVLREHAIETHEGIAGTGVVGVLKNGNPARSIGLRADMDALNLDEANDFSHRSRVAGKMHACGHDGHTAMLLGAACHLSRVRDFEGTIYLVFQPAEENEAGAQKMIKQGLFDRFPMDAIFGMHNMPTLDVGLFAICAGPMMAAFSTFECVIHGQGMHASMPHLAVDPIDIGAQLVSDWKSCVPNSVDPLASAVICTTQFHAGDTWNVMPETAVLKGSTRCFSPTVAAKIETRMRALANGLCKLRNARCDFNYRSLYPPLINDAASTGFAADVAATLVGEQHVNRDLEPLLGSEDFAYLLRRCRGAYILIGNGLDDNGGCMVHSPHYDFNDDILDLGAAYWVNLALAFLQDTPTH